MHTPMIPALRGLFLVFILPLTLLMVPDRTLAQGDPGIAQVAERRHAEARVRVIRAGWPQPPSTASNPSAT